MAANRPRQWKSTAEAAAYAGVSVKTIRRRVLDGSLRAHRVGPRLLRIDAADLDKLFGAVAAVSPAVPARAPKARVKRDTQVPKRLTAAMSAAGFILPNSHG